MTRYRHTLAAVAMMMLPAVAGAAESDTSTSHTAELEVIEVRALPLRSRATESARPVSVLTGEMLDDRKEATLGETLRQEPGIHSTYFGPGAGRPITRGLGGTRVRITEDGLGSLDASALGPDHAVAAEPLLMEGVEVQLIREVILSDGGSRDATARLAEEAGAVMIAGAPSRGGQLRRGVAAAGGDWLLILHADSVLPRGWAGMVRAQMERGGPACFRLRFDAAGAAPALVAGWANLRTRVIGLPYGDQGLLISRTAYDAAGGYPEIALMEDVAMARALRGRIAMLPGAITTSAARYIREGWLRRGARNLTLLLRYLGGADPDRLARRYRDRPDAKAD